MATHDYVIANGSGSAVRQDINGAFAAIATNNADTTPGPTTTYQYQWWADKTSGLMKLRNGDNDAWVSLFNLDGSSLGPGKVTFGATEVVFNDAGNDVDFRIEGDTNANLFFVDAGNDGVGIGTATAPSLLSLQQGSDDSYLRFRQSSEFDAGSVGHVIDSRNTAGNANTQLTLRGNPLTFWNNGEAARIDSSGRLGIGATTVDEHLHIEGTGTQRVKIQATDTSISGLVMMNTNRRYDVQVSGSDLQFYDNTGSAERMKITSLGEVYINQTTQDAAVGGNCKLQVRGTQPEHTAVFRNTNSTPYGPIIAFDTDKNNTGSQFLRCDGGATKRAEIRSNGGLANYSDNNANLSDEREKKNIEPLDSTWSCLKNWELKKFHRNGDADTDDKRYGVIAQQIAPHCPEVITDWVKQTAADAVVDDDGNIVTPAVEEVTRMAVREQQMMWMAIKALQEAQTRIEQLEAKVAALESA